MTRYEVDSAQVATAAASVQARAGTIRSEVAAMHRQLADLQASWRGAAATAFTGVLADWSATEARLDASLEQIVAAMQAAARTYAEAESQASRLFSV
ncbi:WXG100 family type VII secretion target [Cellulomonas fengjieae]|uniref:ESAT-6-like protein n=1 Tax=Cellulomonas fengjieae TaxID=2819978 RepID=A0ABS3SGV4_9CELL|nr:WXG100 family type VII secretion target [Cellulomonas fengjieae]MBO3084969.1 WXG100 family type VII secretion target [Cellulomonas fengjieae]QVI66432.1 WXG100 family type VII secretion target [Cellulomonas fengjieae]